MEWVALWAVDNNNTNNNNISMLSTLIAKLLTAPTANAQLLLFVHDTISSNRFDVIETISTHAAQKWFYFAENQ
jgi:hypothetical protein